MLRGPQFVQLKTVVFFPIYFHHDVYYIYYSLKFLVQIKYPNRVHYFSNHFHHFIKSTYMGKGLDFRLGLACIPLMFVKYLTLPVVKAKSFQLLSISSVSGAFTFFFSFNSVTFWDSYSFNKSIWWITV